MDPPMIRMNKSQGVVANPAMVKYLQLEKHPYSVYVDKERRLIGLDAGAGRRYTATVPKKGTKSTSLSGLRMALEYLGVDVKSPATLSIRIDKNLPPPMLVLIDVNPLLERKVRP